MVILGMFSIGTSTIITTEISDHGLSNSDYCEVCTCVVVYFCHSNANVLMQTVALPGSTTQIN
jgi:hypothetical protein